MTGLFVKSLSFSYGKKEVLIDISFELNGGDWLMVCGANGSGKSTLARALISDMDGAVVIKKDDEELSVSKLKPKARAGCIGLLSQERAARSLYPFLVKDVVALGRYSYGSVLKRKEDRSGTTDESGRMIDKALAITGLSGFAERPVTELSGGELQRVFIAQILAQDPDIMILDEPENSLDLKYRKTLYEVLSQWLFEKAKDRILITIEHDLSIARSYGNKALLLNDGKLLSFGETKDALSDENLKKTFLMDVAEYERELAGVWAPQA